MSAQSIDLIKKLIQVIHETDVAELGYEENGVKIQLKRASAIQTVVSIPQPAPTPVARPVENAPTPTSNGAHHASGENFVAVRSPFVGTFYRSPSPEAPAYAKEGKEVHPGDVLCIIEAMKLMNEIESENHARIVKVLVENGAPVEFGQELFLLAPLS